MIDQFPNDSIILDNDSSYIVYDIKQQLLYSVFRQLLLQKFEEPCENDCDITDYIARYCKKIAYNCKEYRKRIVF